MTANHKAVWDAFIDIWIEQVEADPKARHSAFFIWTPGIKVPTHGGEIMTIAG